MMILVLIVMINRMILIKKKLKVKILMIRNIWFRVKVNLKFERFIEKIKVKKLFHQKLPRLI